MPRLVLDLPEKFCYSTTIDVRKSDINYGNHVGHDTLITMLNECRVRFFEHLGLEEPCIVVADLGINYKSEVFYGDRLKIETGMADFTDHGCDIIFRIVNERTGNQVAIAKEGVVFYDFARRKVADIPKIVRSEFPDSHP